MRADPKEMDRLKAGRADRVSGFARLLAVAEKLETITAYCKSRSPRDEYKSTECVGYNLEVSLPLGV